MQRIGTILCLVVENILFYLIFLRSMNSLKLLFCIISLLISNLLPSQDCTINTHYEQHSCSSFTFFEENEIELQWTVNGQFYQSGGAIDFDASEPGTYEICGYYETSDCPEGPFVCDTIIVSPDCFDDCDFNIAIEQQSCSDYDFFATGEELLDWYVNGEFQLTDVEYYFDAIEPGTYEICAVNEGCPPETTLCETFVVTEDCMEDDCAVGIAINEIDCDTYEIFESSEQQVSWFINDEFISFFHGIDFDPTEAGTYQICAGIETPDCPQGVFVCDTIVVSPDCFDECDFNVAIEQQSCSDYDLIATGEELLDWYVNDEFQLTSVAYNFDVSEPGTYEICAVNEGCPPETTLCETFVIGEDCLEIVSIEETLQDKKITIQPTITTSDFSIHGLSGNYIVHIIDQNGKLVFQKTGSGEVAINCDISNLLPGLYYISILTTDNQLKGIGKVVKM